MRIKMMLLLVLSVQSGESEASPELDWLVGCWADSVAEPASVEMWYPVSDQMLVGVNYNARGSFEYLRVDQLDDTPRYVAQPGGQAPTAFELDETLSAAHHAVFVNPDHDYPQRIEYRRDGDELTATIAAANGEHANSWSWQLIQCQDLVN